MPPVTVERRRALVGPAIVREIAQALAESATLAEAAPRMLAAVCETLGWEYGALWEVDRGGKTLQCVGTWHARSLQVTEFVDISRTTRNEPNPRSYATPLSADADRPRARPICIARRLRTL